MRLIILEHEPALRVARRGSGGPAWAMDRARRTIAVPVPVIAGDTATADRVAEHLRAYHEPLKSTMPGTGEPYDAQSVKMVVFAHVTIFHAALRAYECFAFRDRRLPRRLAGALAPLAVPVVGDWFTKAYLGDDALRLIRNARELTGSAQAA